MNILRSVLLASGLVMGIGHAVAGPPETLDTPLRPLSALEAAGDPEGLYYFNGDKKVSLFDTGQGVAKLDDGQAALENVSSYRVSLGENDPLYGFQSFLEENKLVVVRTRGGDEDSIALERAANDPPESVGYVLPIVREADANAPMLMTDHISVRFKRGFLGNGGQDRVNEIVAPYGLAVASKSPIPDTYMLQLAEGQINHDRLIRAANSLFVWGLENEDAVLYAKPDFIRAKRRFQPPTPADPLYPAQWHLNNTGQASGLADADVDSPESWRVTEGDPDIRVAIIDDSVERDHPDLSPNYTTGIYYNGANGTTNPDPSPRNYRQRHGTPCAGVAVAAANMIGVRGAAPGCGLIGVHFWNSSDQQIAEAFYFCDDPNGDGNTADGAAVISCSWSLNIAPPVDLEIALDDLEENGRNGLGSVILFAAGNDNGPIASNQNLARESVICVGATSDRDERSWYSNFGEELEVVAPSSHTGIAQRIVTTDNTESSPRHPFTNISGYSNGNYTSSGNDGFGGTSSATPLTAGVCGLILSANPQLRSNQVRAILEHTADRIRGGSTHAADYHPITSQDVNYGFGRINAKRAVNIARAAIDNPDCIWPDHVTSLNAVRNGSIANLSWNNPRSDVAGVLVVQYDTNLQPTWRPHDGDRLEVSDVLEDGGVVIASSDTDTLTTQVPLSGANFTVFVYNDDFKYSWGQMVEVGGGSGPAIAFQP